MGNFFKTIGKGLLYIFTLPLLVVFLALYLLVSIVGFIITGIKVMIDFFKGESINGKTKEDIEAEKRLDMWLNPIPHVLQEVEKAKANQQIPVVSVDQISHTPKVEATTPELPVNNAAPQQVKYEPEPEELRSVQLRDIDETITPENEIPNPDDEMLEEPMNMDEIESEDDIK